ncbi:hypothetical protein RvY_00480 [Ramazzottius varieornatus]|uniref:Uncharacterized protein n=1 Tax=Ramazzottius varieornatus TaxID=947166 RepID=A0A1D1UDD5_RAMVA|nr:hypothetical protein RvY_00480 [Ramazzottius varieornatus]
MTQLAKFKKRYSTCGYVTADYQCLDCSFVRKFRRHDAETWWIVDCAGVVAMPPPEPRFQ